MENNSCLIFTDFLIPEVNAELYIHAVNQQEAFKHTKTVGENGNNVINEKWRQSNSIMPKYFIDYYKLLAKKIKVQTADITEKLGLLPFDFGHIEMHLTSHNHSEFYKPHIDNGSGALKNRVITFVYYFHSIPREFAGWAAIVFA